MKYEELKQKIKQENEAIEVKNLENDDDADDEWYLDEDLLLRNHLEALKVNEIDLDLLKKAKLEVKQILRIAEAVIATEDTEFRGGLEKYGKRLEKIADLLLEVEDLSLFTSIEKLISNLKKLIE